MGWRMNEAMLLWGVLFGGIGIGFFSYGRKQRAVVPLLTGVALFVLPYFVPNVTIMVIAGIGLIALPYFVKI